MKKVLCVVSRLIHEDGYCYTNSGDNVYAAALQTYLENAQAEVRYVRYLKEITEEDLEWCDMVLFNSCNRININCNDWLKLAGDFISKLRVPIFFVGMGLQTTHSDTNFSFVKGIEENLMYFLKSVDSVGGAFSVRGHKTAELFEKLGFKNYQITGCPSMFLGGSDFQMSWKPVDRKDFKPVMNGTGILINPKTRDNFNRYPESIFLCQDRFHKILYKNARKIHPIRYSDIFLKLRFGKDIIKYLDDDRIKLFLDVPDWFKYLKENKFDFSFGCRIHGNIMAILSGVPSLIYAIDMRVFELADFLKIPYITELKGKVDMYDLYESLDYSDFNKIYKSCFDNFQNFFDKYEIPCLLEDKNKTSNIEKIINVNRENAPKIRPTFEEEKINRDSKKI